MKIYILWVGHALENYEQEWIGVYTARIRPFFPLELIRIKEQHESSAFETQQKSWNECVKKIPKNSWTVLLHVQGKSFSTEEFVKYFSTVERSSKKSITFIIGGSYGFPSVAKADDLLSLSKFTFPHRMALLILCEQIYRVLSIKAGSPYHHD